jgi:hypothetical protein
LGKNLVLQICANCYKTVLEVPDEVTVLTRFTKEFKANILVGESGGEWELTGSGSHYNLHRQEPTSRAKMTRTASRTYGYSTRMAVTTTR